MSQISKNLIKLIVDEYEKNDNIYLDQINQLKQNLQKLNEEQLIFYFQYKDDNSIKHDAIYNDSISNGFLLPITEEGKQIFVTVKEEKYRYPPDDDDGREYPSFGCSIVYDEKYNARDFYTLGSGRPYVPFFNKSEFRKELSNKTR